MVGPLQTQEEEPQAQKEALAVQPVVVPPPRATPGLPLATLPLPQLPEASAALTDLQEEVEAFLSENKIDERAAAAFRGQPPFVVRAVMDLGSLSSASNPSAALTGRIKKAKEHIENVKREVAAKVETFLAEEEGIDDRAAAQLRMQDPDIQLVVLDRGTLKTSNNPSAALMGRVKKALEPGGSVSRADIYLMRPLARAPTPAPLPAQSPQVTAKSPAMLTATASTPMQNAMLPMIAPGYSTGMMGSFGPMAANSQFPGGCMGGMRGVLGVSPAAYQSFAACGNVNTIAGMAALPWYGASAAHAAISAARPAPY